MHEVIQQTEKPTTAQVQDAHRRLFLSRDESLIRTLESIKPVGNLAVLLEGYQFDDLIRIGRSSIDSMIMVERLEAAVEAFDQELSESDEKDLQEAEAILGSLAVGSILDIDKIKNWITKRTEKDNRLAALRQALADVKNQYPY